jgi:gamma-tubulin complex component 2
MKSVFVFIGLSPRVFFIGIFRLYKFIEDAYTHANRTLLRLLLQDQQLIPRLRSLKRYFFLASSSFLTHLLDLAHTELKKPAKGVSIVKLQSLLDLSLTGEDAAFREDVRVSIASSGLYDWLLKVISVSGVIGGEEGEGVPDEEAKKDRDREKDDKKPMLGMRVNHLLRFLSLLILNKRLMPLHSTTM